MKHFRALYPLFLLFALLIIHGPAAAQDTPYTVTLTIDRLHCIDAQEDGPFENGDEVYVVYSLYTTDSIGRPVEGTLGSGGLFEHIVDDTTVSPVLFQPITVEMTPGYGVGVVIQIMESDDPTKAKQALSDWGDAAGKTNDLLGNTGSQLNMLLTVVQSVSKAGSSTLDLLASDDPLGSVDQTYGDSAVSRWIQAGDNGATQSKTMHQDRLFGTTDYEITYSVSLSGVAQSQPVSETSSSQRASALSAQPLIYGGGAANVTVGDLLNEEGFSNGGVWETFYDKASRSGAQITNGAYALTIAPNFHVWGLGSQLPFYSNTIIQVETTAQSADDNQAYGIICRSAGENVSDGYSFYITGGGSYNIGKFADGNYQPLTDWGYSDAISAGQELTTNTMTAVCVNAYLALYVNGMLVAETFDDSYSSGYIGLQGSNGDQQGTSLDISFDNVEIWGASL